MRKKKVKIITITLLAIIATSSIFAYEKYKEIFRQNVLHDCIIYIPSHSPTYETLTDSLKAGGVLKDYASFEFTANLKKLHKHIHAGKYKLKKGMTNNALVNLFRSGTQSPVKLTFNNIRTIEDFAGKIAKPIEPDSTDFMKLLNNDSLIEKYGFNKENIIAMFIPNTYEVYWNTSAKKMIKRLHAEYNKFWNDKRKAKAKALNLTLKEVSVLASIVQAEQLRHSDERPKIAGLYINRLNRGMALESDPTLIFAAGDFTKKRVLNKDKETDSPYNTYMYKGLPPGPINMPDISSIDAVLNYTKHNYIFMCAKDDFSEYHNFSTNLRQHLIYARKYQQALNKKRIWK